MAPCGHGNAARRGRSRYWPDGRIVDLVDFPFGVVLWSPYRRTVQRGREGVVPALWWAMAAIPHKNWLFSLQAKPFLVAEIGKRQTRPPGLKA